MEYIRKENENLKSYKIRLFANKDLYNLKSQDIADLINKESGENFGESSFRKWYRAYSEGVEDTKKEYISGDKILKEYELKDVELKKEKVKIQTLRLDMNRIIKETSRTELLHEEFINVIKELCNVPLPEFKPLLNQNVEKEYILSFADSHVGKEFKSITNEYSVKIAYDRFNKLLSETIEIIQENNINKLTILALGDVIEGMCLRISQLQQLQIGIIQQTIQFMRFIVSWLNKLSEYVEITYYQAPYANHSQIRPFGTKASDFVLEDMEKIIFTYIYDILQNNSRINIIESEEKYIMFKIFNYNIIACHGHDIRNVDSFLKDVSNKYRIFFDYGFFAHKHTSGSKSVGEGLTNNCEVINIPSIMGCDDYADTLLLGSKAGATLIEFNAKQGKRKTYDIILN